MRRTNTFDIVPLCDTDGELLRRLLDASVALWNELNYERHQRYVDPDSAVWDISDYRERYAGVLGAATVQQIERLKSGRKRGRVRSARTAVRERIRRVTRTR